MKLSAERYEFIKGEVAHYMERCNLSNVPIDAFEFAQKLGIWVKKYSSLSRENRETCRRISDDAFFIEMHLGQGIIFYNDEKPKERVRWTMLHEIGHCVLDHDDSMSDETKEAEASFFAKYAIAPPPLIRKFGAGSPVDVAHIFGVSREASAYIWNYYSKWLTRFNRKPLLKCDEILFSLFKTSRCWLDFPAFERFFEERRNVKETGRTTLN